MNNKNTYLIISSTPPYANHKARAALDIAFTAAAFEQKVSVVFLDDGVLQLLDAQDTQASNLKNIAKMIPALSIYEVENVYVHRPSLAQLGIQPDQVCQDASTIDDETLKDLIAKSEQVMVF